MNPLGRRADMMDDDSGDEGNDMSFPGNSEFIEYDTQWDDDDPGLADWRHTWRNVWGTSGTLRWMIAGTALVFMSLFAFAWTRSAVVATEWFSALIAALAFLAFLAAIVTVELTVPTFRAALSRPKLEISVNIRGGDGTLQPISDGCIISEAGRRFVLHISVMNSGTAPTTGGVNIFTQADCTLSALDKRLEVFGSPLDKVLRPDEPSVPCNVAIARTEFVPGSLYYTFLACIETPTAGTWPIMVGVITSVQDRRTGRYEIEDIGYFFDVVNI
jgi:hypothetical protein